MMYYFYAASGTGKSELAACIGDHYLRNDFDSTMDSKGCLEFLKIPPKTRLRLSIAKTQELNAKYETSFVMPQHCLQSNETIWTTKNGEYIQNYDLPGDKIGRYDDFYETYCPYPYSLVIWDEAQKEASGRDSATMHPRVSTELQLHRKWGLDILLFTQRAKILDLNIRDNARIIEIEGVTHYYDKFGFIVKAVFKLKFFKNLYDLERYLTTDKKTYIHTTYTYEGNPFNHFDSQEGEEYFIDLAIKRGLNARFKELGSDTKEYIENYVSEHPYTPDDAYRKMSRATKDKLKKSKEQQNDN